METFTPNFQIFNANMDYDNIETKPKSNTNIPVSFGEVLNSYCIVRQCGLTYRLSDKVAKLGLLVVLASLKLWLL